MRVLAAILATALGLAAMPAQAEPKDARSLVEGSVERNTRAFHAFVDCLGRRYEGASDRVITSSDWRGEFNNLRRIAKEADCARHANLVSLEADALLIRGVLAEARFEEVMIKAGVQPQFLGLPALVNAAELAAIPQADADGRRRALMFVFADCVARNATGAVVTLLASTTMSQGEQAAFGALGDTMGACMPASEGTELQFSAPALRSYLALAAYYLQREAAGADTRVLASFASPDAKPSVTEGGFE